MKNLSPKIAFGLGLLWLYISLFHSIVLWGLFGHYLVSPQVESGTSKTIKIAFSIPYAQNVEIGETKGWLESEGSIYQITSSTYEGDTLTFNYKENLNARDIFQSLSNEISEHINHEQGESKAFPTALLFLFGYKNNTAKYISLFYKEYIPFNSPKDKSTTYESLKLGTTTPPPRNMI